MSKRAIDPLGEFPGDVAAHKGRKAYKVLYEEAQAELEQLKAERPALAAENGSHSVSAAAIAQLQLTAEALRDERDALRADLSVAQAEIKRLQEATPVAEDDDEKPFDPTKSYRIIAPFSSVIGGPGGSEIIHYKGDHSEIISDPYLLKALHDVSAPMVQI